MNSLPEQLEGLIEQALAELGFELVKLEVHRSKQGTRLVLMVERLDAQELYGSQVSVENCREISREVEHLLEEHDGGLSQYRLEVSSPGLERPLTKPAHYERFAGLKAAIKLTEPQGGRSQYKGQLLGLDNDFVCLRDGEQEWRFPFALIKKANLIYDQERLLADLKRNKKSAQPH